MVSLSVGSEHKRHISKFVYVDLQVIVLLTEFSDIKICKL